MYYNMFDPYDAPCNKAVLDLFIVKYYLTFLRLLSAYRSTLKIVREKNLKMSNT